MHSRLGIFAQPVVSLGFSALALLLLVFVLLSVPGPIKGMYWFQLPIVDHGITQQLRGGVNGWCWQQVSEWVATSHENRFHESPLFGRPQIVHGAL